MTELLSCPIEILQDILSHLGPDDVAYFSAVSRYCRGICHPDGRLWQMQFLRIFDMPDCPATYRWYEALTERFYARKVIEDTRKSSDFERLWTEGCRVVEAVHNSIVGAASPSSPNITFVESLFSHDDHAFSRKFCEILDDVSAVAKFAFYHGPIKADHHNDTALLSALRMVYMRRNYSHEGTFAFLRKGRIHYQLLNAIRLVMEANFDEAARLGSWSQTTGGDTIRPGGYGWPDVARDTSKLTVRDWAGVEKPWVISFAFLDHEVWSIFNDPALGEDALLEVADFKASVGDLVDMHLKLDRPPVSEFSSEERLSPLTFSGWISVRPPRRSAAPGVLSVKGHVFRHDQDDAICWHIDMVFSPTASWVFEGVQIGGTGSKMGVAGVWRYKGPTEVTEWPHMGPCGPIIWFNPPE